MTLKINPFKPNSPVPPGMFAGRLKELESYVQALRQTKNHNPANILLTGERGIGKSSLLSTFEYIASGLMHFGKDEEFNFLPLNIVISENTNLKSLIQLIQVKTKREMGKVEAVKSFLDDTWDFVQRIKILDSGIQSKTTIEDPDLVMDQFAYSLSETCKRISTPKGDEESKDGIIIFIDEADNASEELQLGYFMKVVNEMIQKNGCTNLMFVVAGLPNVREKLLHSHESSLRIFNELTLKLLSAEERRWVIERGMVESKRLNSSEIKMTEGAKKQIATLSEGYPHFIQQFSFSAFEHSEDDEITEADVIDGSTKKGGAIDAIGGRYYESQYNQKIKSDEYREVLVIMSDNWNSWTKKSDIRDKFKGIDNTLTSALKALTERKIILKNPSKQGEYRLQHRGFALWIKLFANRDKT